MNRLARFKVHAATALVLVIANALCFALFVATVIAVIEFVEWLAR